MDFGDTVDTVIKTTSYTGSYAYTIGLAAKLGMVGLAGFLIGAHIGFLQATLDFMEFENSQL